MARIVMKFGGTSMAGIERIRHVAGLVRRETEAGHEVAVVVSAMAGVTNQLVGYVRQIAPLYDHSIVIVEHRGKLAGLAVEQVSRIVSVDVAALGDAASALRALRIDRAYLRGVGETDGEVFVAVDPDEIIAPILSA